ncbi:hypothetical protein O6H91_01G148400 [Diphasiastrum complanatum]|uniref:Uncharacterized protein n=1 Tax=Diphasiastrum complanatum TaxID=34168 RepID=A0ACC2EXL1_DIPCM|nr:hypothetical protein O6H91_01G148400 [Diphasiastrum complanatum]
MGNKLARTTQGSPAEYYLHDLPSSFNLVLKEVLSSGRFLKSVQCVHDEGLLLVKVYFKRGEFLDLKEHDRQLYKIREQLKDIDHSHVWPFQHWHETDKAAYLLRQYFFSNLHDRINTRPFLSTIEKKWLAFQLLLALKQSHERGVCHGDIKCENVLVTSWNWVYLADYASYKPTYIPDDNPSDFSFFFDTGGARRCYLAPERFYDPAIEPIATVEAPLKPSMDIFSLGCVIAELFLEGQSLFDLPQLLSYRKGQYDPRHSLEKVSDSAVRDMILHMIHLNPECRLSPDEYLQSWSHLVFPSYFSPVLHNFFSCLSVLDTDTRVAVTQGAFSEIREKMIAEARAKVSVSKRDPKAVTALKVVKTSPENVLAKNESTMSNLERRGSFNKTDKVGEEGHDVPSKESIFVRSRSLPITSRVDLVNDISSLLIEGDSVSTRKFTQASGRAVSCSSGATIWNLPSAVGKDMDIHSDMKAAERPLLDVEQQKIIARSGVKFGAQFLNKSQPRMEPKSVRRVKAAAIAMAKGIVELQGLVVEEVYEIQFRQADGTYSEGYFHARALSEPYLVAVSGQRKEDVTLPLEGGWKWEGNWEVDLKWANSGWAYSTFSCCDVEAFKGDRLKMEEIVNVSKEGMKNYVFEKAGQKPGVWPYDWTSTESVLRQRRWIRKRRRVACQPLLLSKCHDVQQFRDYESETSTDSGKSSEQVEGSLLKCEGMVLIASLLCACLRNVRLPQARRTAVQLLHDASRHCEDDARLQLIVPFVAALLSDSAAIVRCAALQTLCNVLSLVKIVPPSDVKIFPEYILPLLSMLPDDPEESVRICYANCIHKFAATSFRFLVRSQNVNGVCVDVQRTVVTGPAKHELELAHLRENVARVIQELVMGQKQTPTIRRALLQHVGTLCEFFGQKQTNDFLLPVLPAFLNDRDEQLRAVFFENIVYVCLFVGQVSSEAYLLPYIEQALSDVEETVVVNALECLNALCVQRLLRKRVLLKAVECASPLLCHPGQWVRCAAISFVAATGANLEPADSYAYLIVILCPFLRREPASLSSEAALFACLKPPVSREVFNRVLSDVMLSQISMERAPIRRPVQRGKVHQKAPLPQVSELGLKYNQAGALEDRIEREARPAGYGDTALNKKWGEKWSQSQASLSDSANKLPFVSESEDGEKMKAMEGYIRNLSSTMQTQKHNWEKENSEKLESSTIGLAAGVGAGFYSNYDGSSEGIPLYSVPVSDRRHEGSLWQSSIAQSNPSFNEEWSRVFGVKQGISTFYSGTHVEGHLDRSIETITSSQWDTTGNSLVQSRESLQRSSNSASPTLTRMATSSIHSGVPLGTRKVHEIRKDITYNEGEQENSSLFKSKILTSTNRNLQGQLPLGQYGDNQIPASAALSGFLGMINEDSAANESFWRPRGVLIAHLQEHQRAVNDLSVSSDNAFFVSASDEGRVKIWDCRRLERDISFRSRLTYSFSAGRALRVKMLAADHQVAAASSTGTIHVFSVDYVAHASGSSERYSGISNTRQLETDEGAVLCLQTFGSEGSPMILYSTQRNNIHLWDLRSQKDVWILKKSPDEGFISAIAVDPSCNWLISGTSKGIMTLWDLRFQIQVHSWQHPLKCLIETMTPLLPVSSALPSSAARPFVYVAAGWNEVSLWNAEDGSCHQILRYSADTPDADSGFKWAPNQVSPAPFVAKAIKVASPTDYKVEELQEPPARLPGVRALLPLPGGASILSGGTDGCIRMWDCLRSDRSYCVCGPTVKGPGASILRSYDSKVVSGARVIQEDLGGDTGSSRSKSAKNGLASKVSGGCHRDSITALALAQMSQPLLISSSRDGAVKVWK